MSYERTTWQSGTAPGISAENLNNIEEGIERTHARSMTETERDALTGDDLFTGRIIYNTDEDRLEEYTGTEWQPTGLQPEEAYFELGGDFDADQWCYARKFGGLVVVETAGSLSHSEGANPMSDYVVPEAFRPQHRAVNAVWILNTGVGIFTVLTTGAVECRYRDWTGEFTARSYTFRTMIAVYRRED